MPFARSTGDGGIGVIGEANVNNAVGVFGVSTSASGFGMYGRNQAGGAAMYADGNARQVRDKGGWVKAMLYVNEDGTIARCYNGMTGSSSGNCGFSVGQGAVGGYQINFGFQVNDRFVSVAATEESSHFSHIGANISYGSTSRRARSMAAAQRLAPAAATPSAARSARPMPARKAAGRRVNGGFWSGTLSGGASTPTPTRTSSGTLAPTASATASATRTRTAPGTAATATATRRSPTPSTTATAPVTSTPTATARRATASPTATVSPTSNGVVADDANCDLMVSVADVPALLQAIGTSPPPCGADATGDGAVNDDDLRALLHALFE